MPSSGSWNVPIRAELTDAEGDIQLKLPGLSSDERNQVERDLDALRRRLDEIPAEITKETAAVRKRYAEPTPRLFPAAIEFCIPKRFIPA